MSTVGNWRGPNIVKDSLILYLDASSPNSYSIYLSGTTWKDISSNGNNGLLVNGPIFNNVGKLSSFSFDGVDDYVDTSDVPFRITGYNFSVEFVFYYNNSSYNAIPLLSKRNPNNPFNQFSFNISNGNPYTPASGKVLMGFLRDDNNPNSTTFDRILTYTLPSAGIYHVILKTDQTNSQLWVNGILRSTSSVVLNSGNFTMNGYNLRIANAYTSSYWDNKFYLVRFYRKSLSSSEILQNYNAELYSLYDTDAADFIYVTGISDSTQQSAINQLVIDLKNYGLWTKMRAIYPFVGGTATTHKFNLKDPRDLDVAFRLNFVNSWGHSNTGALPNGVNTYADTFLIPNSVLTLNSTHLSYYSRTNISEAKNEIGCWDGVGIHYTLIGLFRSDISNITYSLIQNTNFPYMSFTDTNSLGFYIGTRTSSTLSTLYKNGVNRTTSSLTSTGNPSTRSIYLGTANGNTLQYSSKEVAFASIGDGLTDTEAVNFYTAVQAFQTTLGRQV